MAEENSHLRKQLEGGAHESTEVRRTSSFCSGEREEGVVGGGCWRCWSGFDPFAIILCCKVLLRYDACIPSGGGDIFCTSENKTCFFFNGISPSRRP